MTILLSFTSIFLLVWVTNKLNVIIGDRTIFGMAYMTYNGRLLPVRWSKYGEKTLVFGINYLIS